MISESDCVTETTNECKLVIVVFGLPFQMIQTNWCQKTQITEKKASNVNYSKKLKSYLITYFQLNFARCCPWPILALDLSAEWRKFRALTIIDASIKKESMPLHIWNLILLKMNRIFSETFQSRQALPSLLTGDMYFSSWIVRWKTAFV